MHRRSYRTAIILVLLPGAVIAWLALSPREAGSHPPGGETAGPRIARPERQTNRNVETAASHDGLKNTPEAASERSAKLEPFLALVAHDPAAAARQAHEFGDDVIPVVAAAWAEKDLAAASDWARSLAGSAREVALATLATETASRDVQMALNLAMEMQENSPQQHETLAFVSAQWAATDAEGALAWTREISDDHLQSLIERRVLPAIADSEPSLAADYLAKDVTDPALQLAVAPEILQRWAQSDPAAAVAWAAAFPSEPLRTRSLDALFRVWAHEDTAAMQTWLTQQPAGSLRDEAASAISAIFASTDRAAALEYARSISDPALRNAAIARSGDL
ncbi:MAG: hypothetical protein V4733_10435 [Verrucomicrobiota bacterium]